MLIIERKNKYLLIALQTGVYSQYYVKKSGNLFVPEINCDKPTMMVYKIFDSLIEACKYYRNYQKTDFIPLNNKVAENSDITKLTQGGIFWIWNEHYDEVMYSDHDTNVSAEAGQDLINTASALYDAGIKNAMIGIFFEADSPYVEQLYKKFGYIATQYDNYNDVLNPALLEIIPNNRVKSCDYTRRRMKDYPDGIIVNDKGELAHAWALKGFDNEFHFQNKLCPLIAKQRMKEEVPQILNDFPYYKGRFIDVFATGLSTCCSQSHPITRDKALDVENDAFLFLKNSGLITGTEDGFEGVINNLVYSEGLHSPVYWRFKDCGRSHAHLHSSEQTWHLLKYMMNPKNRIPLWQLVHHEDMLSFPYWGDSVTASPHNTRKKVLFSCLYGCPPLYSFSVKDFPKLKNDIVGSYKAITSVMEKVATLPMTNFEILTEDYNIQQSVFGDKYEITVNFGDKDYNLNGVTIPANDYVLRYVK